MQPYTDTVKYIFLVVEDHVYSQQTTPQKWHDPSQVAYIGDYLTYISVLGGQVLERSFRISRLLTIEPDVSENHMILSSERKKGSCYIS